MGTKRTDEFRQDAVRIALTSGLTRRQVADDLGVGLSTLVTIRSKVPMKEALDRMGLSEEATLKSVIGHAQDLRQAAQNCPEPA